MNEYSPSLAFEVKNLDEAGYIEGLAAGYGNVDFGNDRILSGAFSKSIAQRQSVPMLLYHDMKRPAGKWGKLTETDAGLLVEGKISTKTRDGGEAYEYVKDGALSALSIGYDTLRKRMDGKVRELIELELHEVSLVTIGMNPRATVTGVKSILEAGNLPSLSEFEDFLREAGFSKSQATAIAGKGLASLLRGEPGNASATLRGEPTSNADEFFSALAAQLRI